MNNDLITAIMPQPEAQLIDLNLLKLIGQPCSLLDYIMDIDISSMEYKK